MSVQNILTRDAFFGQLREARERIGVSYFDYDSLKSDANEELIYQRIETYANNHQLFYTALALPLVRGIMTSSQGVTNLNLHGVTRLRGHYVHALDVCRLLINMSLPFSAEEKDQLYAAALCHIIPNVLALSDLEKDLQERFLLTPVISRIISLITSDTDLSAEGRALYYRRIQEDRYALIVFLTDRGNLLQHLNTIPLLSANEYIYETRTLMFPACIYAKEHYPELIPAITVMMEKLRTIIDVSGVLLKRYETREMELTKEILQLKEENSRIRMIIEELKHIEE